MTRTEELMKLCDGSTTLAALLQEDLRQLIELVRLQHRAISDCVGWGVHYGRHCEQPMKEAIAAFNKFEGGE